MSYCKGDPDQRVTAVTPIGLGGGKERSRTEEDLPGARATRAQQRNIYRRQRNIYSVQGAAREQGHGHGQSLCQTPGRRRSGPRDECLPTALKLHSL